MSNMRHGREDVEAACFEDQIAAPVGLLRSSGDRRHVGIAGSACDRTLDGDLVPETGRIDGTIATIRGGSAFRDCQQRDQRPVGGPDVHFHARRALRSVHQTDSVRISK